MTIDREMDVRTDGRMDGQTNGSICTDGKWRFARKGRQMLARIKERDMNRMTDRWTNAVKDARRDQRMDR